LPKIANLFLTTSILDPVRGRVPFQFWNGARAQ